MKNHDMTWTVLPDEPMMVGIWLTRAAYDAKEVPAMRIFVGEIMESAGRKGVMQHVKECDRSPWLPRWKEDYHKTFNALK